MGYISTSNLLSFLNGITSVLQLPQTFSFFSFTWERHLSCIDCDDIPFPYLICLYLIFMPFGLLTKLHCKAFYSVILLLGLLLIPTMNFTFIQSGSGNANYLYFQSIVYLTAIHQLGVQSIALSVEVMRKLQKKNKLLLYRYPIQNSSFSFYL